MDDIEKLTIDDEEHIVDVEITTEPIIEEPPKPKAKPKLKKSTIGSKNKKEILGYLEKAKELVNHEDIQKLEKLNIIKHKDKSARKYKLTEIGLSEYVKKIIDFFNNSAIKNLYVSIDIDALDPSIAPGTGFAIPGGFSYREMWNILRELTKNFNIRAFDLVEVAPNLDNANNMTCNLAAKLIIEFISFIAESKGDI